MNHKRNNEALLGDVFSEGALGDCGDALLNEMLHLARRKRRLRQTRHLCGALVAFAAVVILIQPGALNRSSKPQPLRQACQLVQTKPLSAGQIAVTRPLSSQQIVASVETANIVHTRTGDIAISEISDDELLALAPQPAALVRRGPREMELVIVEPAGQSDEPIN